jgi:DNA-binding Xre family transcriptional regulator
MASGRPVGIDAWLAWCAALGLDPRSGRKTAEGARAYSGGAFLGWYFGAAVHLTRETTHAWTIRDLERHSHLSIATLSRIETGKQVSAAAVAAVCRTLDLHPHDYCEPKEAQSAERATGKQDQEARSGSRGEEAQGADREAEKAAIGKQTTVPRETAAETRCDQREIAEWSRPATRRATRGSIDLTGDAK